MESTALKVEAWMKRFGLFAAMVLIAALFCFTVAAAEPAAETETEKPHDEIA